MFSFVHPTHPAYSGDYLLPRSMPYRTAFKAPLRLPANNGVITFDISIKTETITD